VNLLDSLLDAIVRLDGDALVMHVGEKPYVVTTSEARNQFRGPLAWGQVELSSRVLTPDAVAGMLGQILPLEQRSALEEYGATEYEAIAANHPEEQFTIVAARGGDDIWIEMRRRPVLSADAAAVIASLRDEEPPAVDDPPAEAQGSTEALCAVAGEAAETAHPGEPSRELENYAALETMATDEPGEEVGVAADLAAEPLAVELDLSHLMDDHEPRSEESYSIDIDSDRDLAEELTSLDAGFDGGMLGGSHDWHDDVMTEGELGELLRATAAAVIAGEIRPDESAQPVSFAQLDTPIGQIAGELTSSTPAVGLVEADVSELLVVPAVDSGQRLGVERQVARATEELPVLVAYQIEHDRVPSQSTDEDRPMSGPGKIAAEPEDAVESEDTELEIVQELRVPVVIEPAAVLVTESLPPANDPIPSASDQPAAPAAPDVAETEEAGKERRRSTGGRCACEP
jgi:hypothetical protein